MTFSDPTASTTDYTASAGVHAAAPATASAAVTAEAGGATPAPTAPARSQAGVVVLAIVGIVVLGIVALFVSAYLVAGLGAGAFFGAGLLAVLPLIVVFFAVRWIDRWEPEPRLAVLFAFLWGASASVAITLLVGAEIDNVINSMGGPGPGYEFFAAAIQAPIVEEIAKGIGILIIFWAARKHFDGPVDGLVYAAWVAGGFAFTENILYFGATIVEGGPTSDLLVVFLMRGIMSPFAHVMFTALTGIAIGLAARRTGAFGVIGFFLVGLIPAILLHALWNGALFFVSDFFGYYAIVQVPLFVMAVVIVFWLRRQEAKLTHDRLAEYAQAGWFAPDEITAIATKPGRRQTMAWARQHGKAPQMKRYLTDATRLAFARQRIITGRDRIGAQADEQQLLAALLSSRAALSA